jgi:hypothetical protein
MSRYIIIEKDLGVFAGVFDKYPVFAKNDIFGFNRITSFSSRENAEEWIHNYLNKDKNEFDIVEIETPYDFVTIIDVIRSGYGQYTHYMMDNIPMISDKIH